jgi:hypothetical protein
VAGGVLMGVAAVVAATLLRVPVDRDEPAAPGRG